jgi:hypothetical protein
MSHPPLLLIPYQLFLPHSSSLILLFLSILRCLFPLLLLSSSYDSLLFFPPYIFFFPILIFFFLLLRQSSLLFIYKAYPSPIQLYCSLRNGLCISHYLSFFLQANFKTFQFPFRLLIQFHLQSTF